MTDETLVLNEAHRLWMEDIRDDPGRVGELHGPVLDALAKFGLVVEAETYQNAEQPREKEHELSDWGRFVLDAKPPVTFVCLSWARMANRRMAEKLAQGDALDVGPHREPESESVRRVPRATPRYLLPPGFYRDGVDYCDAGREAWIWSVGRRLSDGAVLASTSADLYQNPAFECLWLR